MLVKTGSQPAGNYIAGYRQMEKAYKEGKVRSIGLSNFNKEQINEILSVCEVRPAVLQTELHPYFQEIELKKILKAAPHKDCMRIARSDFSSDCTKATQEYSRISRSFRAR